MSYNWIQDLSITSCALIIADYIVDGFITKLTIHNRDFDIIQQSLGEIAYIFYSLYTFAKTSSHFRSIKYAIQFDQRYIYSPIHDR